MTNTNNKWNIAEIKTGYFVIFGAIIGAIVGVVTYLKDWL